MICEIITVTISELNSGCVVKSLQDYSIPLSDGIRVLTYRPTSVEINNTSGAELYFGLYTADEYAALISGGYSPNPNLIPVISGGSETISGMKGEITKLYVSGTSSHHANVDFVILKDL